MNVIIVGYVHTLIPWMPSRTVYKAINVGNYCGVGLVGVKLSKQPKGKVDIFSVSQTGRKCDITKYSHLVLIFYPFNSPLINLLNLYIALMF